MLLSLFSSSLCKIFVCPGSVRDLLCSLGKAGGTLVAAQVTAATQDPCHVMEGWRTGLAAVAQGDLMEQLWASSYHFHQLSLRAPQGLVFPDSIHGVSWGWRDRCRLLLCYYFWPAVGLECRKWVFHLGGCLHVLLKWNISLGVAFLNSDKL